MTTLDIIRKTKAAWSALRDADAETKNRFLTAMADSLVEHTAEILTCNETDLEAARGRISDGMLDRLRLDESRIAAMAEGIRATVKLPDHTGRILSETHHANGMTIYKKQVPLGLVAIIYESRPNVLRCGGTDSEKRQRLRSPQRERGRPHLHRHRKGAEAGDFRRGRRPGHREYSGGYQS